MKCLIAGLLAALPLAAFPQSYPTKPIRFVVPFAAGGPMDVMSRALAEGLTRNLGQQVVIDNRSGAGGGIGTEIVAKSAPDGYTVMAGHIGTHAINVSLYSKLGYDPVKDFAPVSLMATLPLGLFVNASVPVKSVSELIALAKAKPGYLNFASAGSGGPTHMAGEMLKAMAQIDIVHVPYKGNAAALGDLVAGRVQMMFSNLLTAMPHVKSGRLRGIAVSSGKRTPQAPDLPTVAESGIPGYDITPWYGLFAPAGTPKAIVSRLHKETREILNAPDLNERFRSQGVDLVTCTPDELMALIKTEIPKWRDIVKKSGASVG